MAASDVGGLDHREDEGDISTVIIYLFTSFLSGS